MATATFPTDVQILAEPADLSRAARSFQISTSPCARLFKKTDRTWAQPQREDQNDVN
jgi:hypothetical protein